MPTSASDVYIYESLRTPRVRATDLGSMPRLKPHEMAAAMLSSLRERSGIKPSDLGDFLLGCVVAGRASHYNFAQAALQAVDWADVVSGMQVSRFGASGLAAMHLAAARIAAGWDSLLVSGAVATEDGRMGTGKDMPLGDPELILESKSIPRGVSADLMATVCGVSRAAVDAFAARSMERSLNGNRDHNAANIIAVYDHLALPDKNAATESRSSEQLRAALAELPPAYASLGALGFDALALRRYPAFQRIHHVHTAGNSAAPVTGGALILLGSEEAGQKFGWTPRARILGCAAASTDPTLAWMGAIAATECVLERTGLKFADLDLVEVQETFGTIPVAFCSHFNADHARVNINGGAIATGTCIGADGSMLLNDLIAELTQREKRLGLVAISTEGGQGMAVVVERC